MLACCNAERRTGRPSATSGGRRSRGVHPVGLREVSVCASFWCDVESLRGRRARSAGASFAGGPPAATRLPVPRRDPPRPGRGDRHRRGQRRARRDRGCQRPLERPAGPVDAQRADLRPADRRLRPDRHRPARARSSRSAAGSSPSTRSRGSSSTRRRPPRTGRSGRTRASTRPRSSPRSPRTPAASSDRGASTITQQLVRARLLPPDATAAGADRYIRKAKELIQSSRLTDALPGRGRQAADHLGLPQPDLLRPRRLRDRGRGRHLLRRHRPREAHARPGGAPRRPAEVALDARPVPLRRGRTTRAASSSRRLRRRSSAATTSSRTSDARRWTTLSPAELAGARSTSRSSSSATGRCRSRRRTSRGRSGASSTRSSATDAPIETGGYTVITTLDWNAQTPGRAVARRPRSIAPNLKKDAGVRLLRSLKIPAVGPSLDRRPAGQGPPQRVARRARLPDRRRPRLRRQRGLLPGEPREPQVRAEVRRRRRRRAPARIGLEADRLRERVRHRRADAGQPPPRHHDRVRHSGWTPRDADQLDRGPVLVRKALQYSLNIPAIRALQRVGSEAVADRAAKFGHPLHGRQEGVPPGRPRRRDRDGRGPAARPDLGLRRHRQRRRRASRRG